MSLYSEKTSNAVSLPTNALGVPIGTTPATTTTAACEEQFSVVLLPSPSPGACFPNHAVLVISDYLCGKMRFWGMFWSFYFYFLFFFCKVRILACCYAIYNLSCCSLRCSCSKVLPLCCFNPDLPSFSQPFVKLKLSVMGVMRQRVGVIFVLW